MHLGRVGLIALPLSWKSTGALTLIALALVPRPLTRDASIALTLIALAQVALVALIA